ncbi:LEA type 2 family protein [Halomicrobium salinisoli]|uniref:LEA type 2 family protein n=1 Tax=Halomicrobium salinisoli TaxID=2878391 RepID=UPI001CF06B36|nr:LEA type 2 family protein [Halomicrobium salinisoli]
MARILSLLAVAGVVIVGAVGAGFALGALGAPSVTGIHNQFGDVNESTTVIESELGINNPNPIGVSVGDVGVDYTVRMNDVPMANGSKEGVSIGTGNSSVSLTTRMANERIPAWWYSHVRNGERTGVSVDATVSAPLVGERDVSLDQAREIETDLLSGFDSDETRPINTSGPLPSDPALYVNGTEGEWDRENLTRERTPMALRFDVHNPKPYPYTVSKIGYTITMNDVTVGEGETDRGQVIAPGETTTIRADTAIRNERLDDWWVTHLERNQVTEMHVDFYLIFEFQGEQFRVNPDELGYTTTIETDVFGTKDAGTGGDGSSADGDETATPTASDGTATPGGDSQTATPTPTASGDDATATPTGESTPTPTPTDGDGGLLG